jgi:hypothetical protein
LSREPGACFALLRGALHALEKDETMVTTDWEVCPHCLRQHPGRPCLGELTDADRAQRRKLDERLKNRPLPPNWQNDIGAPHMD